MKTKYAYSYDREDYTGSYDTPEAAFNDAVAKSEGLDSPPTTIYIGTIVEPDPQVADHAEGIIEAMNRRAHVDFGKSAADYLRRVSKDKVQQLDEALASAILDWLRKNNLMPNFVRISQVREFPVKTPAGIRTAPTDEVQEIGVEPQTPPEV